jgi:hypothetical protein
MLAIYDNKIKQHNTEKKTEARRLITYHTIYNKYNITMHKKDERRQKKMKNKHNRFYCYLNLVMILPN